VLVELRLENYAVIDNVAVAFAPGLNLLTGETGAGKSILIDALALLLGEKASSDVIRTGADRAVISAVFEAEAASEIPLANILESNGLDESDDGSLILRREIAAGGKGRVFVNNQPATVAVLRQFAPHLAIIHAQNESMLSFDGPRAWLCSTLLPAVNSSPSPSRSLRGSKFATALKTSNTGSRTAFAWSTCGPSRNAKSKKQNCSPAKTSDSKPRSSSWPTRKKSTTPP
jgi:energy-coupling factor transporter ATP-binding protein EcfA2